MYQRGKLRYHNSIAHSFFKMGKFWGYIYILCIQRPLSTIIKDCNYVRGIIRLDYIYAFLNIAHLIGFSLCDLIDLFWTIEGCDVG